MASPQLILELSKGFFNRNNPVQGVVANITQAVHSVLTYKSKMRLLKYKFMLAQQQMSEMEEHIVSGAVEPSGGRLDRPF